jgi:peptidoglycan/xylan/chitin deacetylase (PgdA/CDA1 family)
VTRTVLAILMAISIGGSPLAADGVRRVAVTIDDLPVASSTLTDNASWSRITTDLLEAIDRHDVPAVGFVNESKLYRDDELDPARVTLLEMWLDAGLELGNHTFSHPDLHHTELEPFQQDVLRGQLVTRPLVAEYDRALRYFRHPFLHTGRDLGTRQALEEFLEQHGYRVAPVTIDNSEWIFARAYDLAADAEQSEAMKRVAESYIDYMEQKFEYFERQTVELFGRSIPHVLLLHANALNADHFDSLARMLVKRGYTFITLDEALADEAYRSRDGYTGPGGITWLHRWALTQGKRGEFFRGEPRTPEFVLQMAGVESE